MYKFLMNKSILTLTPVILILSFLAFSCTDYIRQDRNEYERDSSGSLKYPGPFCPTTTFSFEIADSANVEVVVYDLMGIAIDTVIFDNLPPGTHEVDWDSSTFESGVYFYKLWSIAIPSGDTTVVTKKMVLLK